MTKNLTLTEKIEKILKRLLSFLWSLKKEYIKLSTDSITIWRSIFNLPIKRQLPIVPSVNCSLDQRTIYINECSICRFKNSLRILKRLLDLQVVLRSSNSSICRWNTSSIWRSDFDMHKFFNLQLKYYFDLQIILRYIVLQSLDSSCR